MTLFYKGVAGKRGYKPTKIVIHNDAGSKNATAAFYKSWLPTRAAENGFAHYYVATDGIYEAEDPMYKAWHCANSVGNRDYIGIEICQQLGDDKTFLANEQKGFKLAADLCKKFNIAVTVANFPLHQELSSTSCPAKSLVLHGKTRQALKEYNIAQVKKYLNQGSTSSQKPSTGSNKVTDTTKFKDGSKVKVKTSATHYQTGESIANFVKGSTYKVKSSKVVNQSRSKYAFLLDGISSWVLAQDLSSVSSSASTSTGNSSSSLKGANLPNKGHYTVKVATNIRSGASTSSSIVGSYSAGEGFNYDSKRVAGGYVWLSYIAAKSKQRRYVAVV